MTEVLVKKSLIVVDPKPSSEHGDTPPPPPLISRLLLIQLDADYVSDSTSEQQEVSSPQARPADEVFIPETEESRDVNAALLPHKEKEEERRQGDVPRTANCAATSVSCGGQVTCEVEYVHFSFMGECDAETERTRLMCESEYLPNTGPTCSDQLTDSC